jgi:DNA-binding transcriptional MocR family regulator
MALNEKALQEKISISPGIIFSPSRSYRNCLRLNCGLPWSSTVEEALKTLGTLTHQLLATSVEK